MPPHVLMWYWHSDYDTWVCFMLNPKEHNYETPFVIESNRGPTDEGHFTLETRVFMGETGLHIITEEAGADCDGSYSRHSHHVCEYDVMNPCYIRTRKRDVAGPEDDHPRFLPFEIPDFREFDSYQRDHSAEQAGY